MNKFCVMITTYNRPSCLLQLTKKLKSLEDCFIVVVDDGTNKVIDDTYIDILVKKKNGGKTGWWNTVNILWAEARKVDSKYYMMMVDDSLPNENFFKESLRLWNSIKDRNKIAMHLANNGREKNWTNFSRVDYNKNIFWTQTTETTFISTRQFITYNIPPIPKSRWAENKALGSGVFPLLNKYWVSKGRTIYGVKKSLIHANKNCKESKMNKSERIKNPWILK